MAEIIKVYRQSLPAMKFVGKRYLEEQKVDGTFGVYWGEWFEKGWFEPLKFNDGGEEPFEDCNAFIGLCRFTQDEPFEYWIGVFAPQSAEAPEGYQSLDIEAGDVAVAWIYGREPDVYMCCPISRMESEGYELTNDSHGVQYGFERYVCPRFTEPDKDGNIILDMCYYVK